MTMLRKHQQELADVVREIFDGATITDILVHATPGAGKSALPIIMARLIDAGLADALCWIVPRRSLRYQAEQNFMDPFFRKLLMHDQTIRAAMNDYMPCRGHAGFVTTYQAMSAGNDKIIDDFKRKKYILVLDEFHHLDKNGEWHKAIEPLYQLSKYRLLMTGTIERGDKKEIAYLPYDRYRLSSSTEEIRPRLQETDTRKVIIYSRKDALSERAILPVNFVLHDGKAKWKEDGKEQAGRISRIKKKDAKTLSAVMYTALETEYATSLVETGLADWLQYRKRVPSAKALVVTANIKAAKRIQKVMHGLGIYADIATSDDSQAAHRAIQAFKKGQRDCLIGVAMFYEGFDCKQVSHIICLTNIRSTPWIEQMVARAVRIDPALPYENQMAHIFAPDDVLFREIMQKIVSEQNSYTLKKVTNRQVQESLFDGDEGSEQSIIPIGSKLDGKRKFTIGHEVFGVPCTPSDHERNIRIEIDKLSKKLALAKGVHPKRVNTDLIMQFGKPRAAMEFNELVKVRRYLNEKLNSLKGRRPARRITVKPWKGAI